ncbi:DUF4135 domain-containing protein [Microbacterium sp.]|uniref:DUF4135 domain-containing protein n=1 Tax=Microbacterium sp. TaxID=51671 RepID=UPI003A91A626
MVDAEAFTAELARWLLPWAARAGLGPRLVESPEEVLGEFLTTGDATQSLGQAAGVAFYSNSQRWVAELARLFPGTTVSPNHGDPHAGARSATRVESDTTYFLKPDRVDPSAMLRALETRIGLDFGIDVPPAQEIGAHLLQDSVAEKVPSTLMPTTVREQFWRNAGRATAVLDVLGFNDGHYENVWPTTGGRLVLVDDETLLVPRLLSPEAERSVLQTGLIQKPHAKGVLRINSALMARTLTPLAMNYPRVIRTGAGDLELRFERPRDTPRTPLTVAYGTMLAYLEDFIAGLREAYDAIHSVPAADFISTVTNNLHGYTSRLVLNATLNYRAAIARLALLPSGEKDVQSIEAELSNEKTEAVGSRQVADSEIRQLLGGDVPVFRIGFGEHAVVDPGGQAVGQISRTALHDMTEVLGALGSGYAQRQEDIVRNQAWRMEDFAS